MRKRLSETASNTDRPRGDTPSTNGQSEAASSSTAILLIDDNPSVASAIDIAFRMAGHRLDIASRPEEAYSQLARYRYDAILLDMNFTPGAANGEEGLACLGRIVADDPAACVIVITAHSGLRIAVAAMQAGARDFVMKPWRNADLVAKVESAIARGPTVRLTTIPGASAGEPPPVLLGESAAMHRLRDLIRRVGPTPAGISVTGRPGSGRTLAARAIHASSRDADGPILRIDLRSDEAWAHLADATGTIVLRHPDWLDRIAQERLVGRLLQTVRYIAIADSIEPLVPALRHRIATVEIAVPPLAERGEDAVLLARHFARAAVERFGRPPVYLTQAAEAALRVAVWPDDVRGLALAVERAVLLADNGTIDAAALAPSTPAVAIPSATREGSFDLTDAEKAMIEAALHEHRHNVTHAAAALGLSRGALYRRMARYGF